MASSSSSKKLLLLRKPLCRALKPNFSPSPSSSIIQRSFLSSSSSSTHNKYLLEPSVTISKSFLSELSRSYCSRSSPLPDASQGPAAIDYRYVCYMCNNFSSSYLLPTSMFGIFLFIFLSDYRIFLNKD